MRCVCKTSCEGGREKLEARVRQGAAAGQQYVLEENGGSSSGAGAKLEQRPPPTSSKRWAWVGTHWVCPTLLRHPPLQQAVQMACAHTSRPPSSQARCCWRPFQLPGQHTLVLAHLLARLELGPGFASSPPTYIPTYVPSSGTSPCICQGGGPRFPHPRASNLLMRAHPGDHAAAGAWARSGRPPTSFVHRRTGGTGVLLRRPHTEGDGRRSTRSGPGAVAGGADVWNGLPASMRKPRPLPS